MTRGGRSALVKLSMSSQSLWAHDVPSASSFAGAARPPGSGAAAVSPLTLLHWVTSVALVMAPRPPETPRVLPSKSCISSKMPVWLKMRRFCVPGPCENEPAIDTVCRGPAANVQVTLSVSPSGWQLPQLDQPSPPLAPLAPALDQRPRPVKKKRLPRCADSSSTPCGAGEDSTVAISDWLVRSTTPRRRVTQQLT